MWDYDSLYNKAKLFVRKGLGHQEPQSAEIPLWYILSLELLARATLSRISPALLADPRDGSNILFALGFQRLPSGRTAPASVPARTVFSRCAVVCEKFTEQDSKRCTEWLNWRNEELHTGKLPFENLRTSIWQPDFFRICSILLEQNNTSLEDFVGTDFANHAKTMVSAFSENEREVARNSVKAAKEKFQGLGVEERLEKIKFGEEKSKDLQSKFPGCKEIECPSCEGRALIGGELVRSTIPRHQDGELAQEDVWLPNIVRCECCGLKIRGHARVSALGFGDQFVSTDFLDPRDHFEIEFDPSDYFDYDYGNE